MPPNRRPSLLHSRADCSAGEWLYGFRAIAWTTLQHGPPAANREVPTLEAFAPTFVDGHARANRHKPSGIASIGSILKWHLVPTLGQKRLDAIAHEQVRLKLALAERAPKTVNNVLTVLSTLLKKAVEWGKLERLPCVVKLLPNAKKTMGFHDFDQYERLLTVARKRREANERSE